MRAYDSMSFWDTYRLPVPLRKWLIVRQNKFVEQQNSQNMHTKDEPLTQSERVRMINQAQQAKPLSARTFMNPTRNR